MNLNNNLNEKKRSTARTREKNAKRTFKSYRFKISDNKEKKKNKNLNAMK